MDELDMSRPGTELFPETSSAQYNSYQDVNTGQDVGDPLNTGVTNQPDAAGQVQLSEKELNFRALRDEVSKMKEEREYWKGQAEAYSRQPARLPEPGPVPNQQQQEADALAALDLDDGRDVRKALDIMRQENMRMKSEILDSVAAMSTKTQHQDWNSMVTQHVPQLTNKNPIFAEMIQKASNPYEAAYLLAELNARASAPPPAQAQPPPINGNAQRAMANAQKPQPLASIGGTGTLSSADYYATMSDEDFMKIAARNLANI